MDNFKKSPKRYVNLFRSSNAYHIETMDPM